MKAARRRKQPLRIELDGLLAQLEDTQLLRRAQDPELAYLFKHVLTQETAYQSLLVKRRREIHRQVAECYEQVYADDLDQHAAMLAQHYAEAGDDAKTLEYATRAADRAAQVYANAEALAHYTQALEVARRAGTSGDRLIHLYTRRGRVLELSGQYAEALTTYEEMQALARERDDHALELASLMAQATIHAAPTVVHDQEHGRTLSMQALDLARELDDRPAQSKIYWNLMLLHSIPGYLRQAIAYGEQSLEIARELNLREQLAFTLNDLFNMYASVGQIEQAWSALIEARQLWRELGNLPMLTDNLNNSSYLRFIHGDFEQVIRQSDEAYQISQSIGNLWGQSNSLMLVSYIHLEFGQMDKAIEVSEECIRLGEQAGFVVPQVISRSFLGLAYAFLGDFDRAFQLVRLALAKAEELVPMTQLSAKTMLAEIHFLKGDLAEAEAILQEGRGRFTWDELGDPGPMFAFLTEGELALARRDGPRALALADDFITMLLKLGVRLFMTDALYLKGRALLGQGQTEQAYQALQEARAEAEALNSRRILWEILFTLSQIEAERGNTAEAQDLRRQAREVVAYIADHAGSPELRASFLGLPKVRAVLSTDLGNGLNE
jgi:tetratricopeptide (TPR) repeat protein